MIKIVVALLTVVALTACTTRTEIIPECKDGILHFTYKQTQHETGIIQKQVKGVLTYEDDSVVRCIDEKQKLLLQHKVLLIINDQSVMNAVQARVGQHVQTICFL